MLLIESEEIQTTLEKIKLPVILHTEITINNILLYVSPYIPECGSSQDGFVDCFKKKN